MVCVDCDAEVEEDWHFCRDCGASLITEDDDRTKPLAVLRGQSHVGDAGSDNDHGSPSTPYQVERRPENEREALAGHRPRWVMATTVALALILIFAVSLLAVNDGGTHQVLSQTRANLTSTNHRLSTTEARLKTTSSQLDAVTKDRDSLSLQVLAQSSQVNGLQNSLSNAQQQVNLQAGQISILKSCLSGVATALNDVAIGDYVSATSALDAVQVSCQSSAALFQNG